MPTMSPTAAKGTALRLFFALVLAKYIAQPPIFCAIFVDFFQKNTTEQNLALQISSKLLPVIRKPLILRHHLRPEKHGICPKTLHTVPHKIPRPS